jgi:hypothetical protein
MFYIAIGVVILITIARFLGMRIRNKEDSDILDLYPNHPSKISKSIFPVGAGKCSARKRDRHIWFYSEYLDEIPYERTCTYCGYKERKYMTDNKWRGPGE